MKICEKSSRIIPITNFVLWENLKIRAKKQYDLWRSGIYGSNPEDYVLFDGINKASSYTRLHQAYFRLQRKQKTWHCLSHTAGTNLFGTTGIENCANKFRPRIKSRFREMQPRLRRDGSGFFKARTQKRH